MDSNQFLCGKKEGYSKAQACLQKILGIICSVPPHQLNSKPKPAHLLQFDASSFSSTSHEKAQSSGNKGFLFDLNMELTSSPDRSTDQNQSNREAVEDDCSYEKDESLFVGEKDPVSETNVPDVNNEKERLALTVESGEVSWENSSWASETRSKIRGQKPEKKKRGRRPPALDLYGRSDDASPLVKRGRKRVLPCRYKDSELLQRLARNAASTKRHRLRFMN